MLISAIIPTWNREKTIKRAVESVLHQSLPVSEVLVCDDGSTDSSQEIVNSIGDPRVRWIKGVHSGLPAVPRNLGIRESKGEWLAFLDSDDEWMPYKLEKQLEEATLRTAGAVCSDSWRIRPGAFGPEPMLGGCNALISFSDLMQVNKVICSSMIVNREIIGLTSGFPENPEMVAIEDYALWLQVADLTDIAYLASPLLNYTDEPETSLRCKGRSVCEQRQLVMKSFIDWKSRRGVCSVNYWKVRLRLLLDLF